MSTMDAIAGYSMRRAHYSAVMRMAERVTDESRFKLRTRSSLSL